MTKTGCFKSCHFIPALLLVATLLQTCTAGTFVNIDSQRVVNQLHELGLISTAAAPAVTRVLYTEKDVEARAYLRGLAEGIGLELRDDAIGNMFARLPAAAGSTLSGVVGTGSHHDAIPISGMYDGTLGVLGGLEALRALRDAGFKPDRPIEVLAFTSEEPTRFGLSCLGSRALVGAKTWDDLLLLKDNAGVSFDEARKEGKISGEAHGSSIELPNGYYSAFVELHIEQGRRLEGDALDIGKTFRTRSLLHNIASTKTRAFWQGTE